MIKKKPSLVDINKNLDLPQEKPSIKRISTAFQQENPKRGNRGDFKRFSLTLPKHMLDALRSISLKRKVEERLNYELTSIVREALASFIKKESNEK